MIGNTTVGHIPSAKMPNSERIWREVLCRATRERLGGRRGRDRFSRNLERSRRLMHAKVQVRILSSTNPPHSDPQERRRLLLRFLKPTIPQLRSELLKF